MKLKHDERLPLLIIITAILLIAYGYCIAHSTVALTYTYDPQLVIDEAITHLGKPYVYAANGPNAFDCTGFTCYCYSTVYGITLKRSAYEQGYDDTYTKLYEWCNLKPGDIVYFNTNGGDSDLSDHAGIYIGNGEFIHASSGKGGVVISSLWEGYYNKRFSWGRRVLS